MNTGLNDWTWFHDHPQRAYRCRLATSAEIADLREYVAFSADIKQGDRFVHAIVRYHRESNQLEKIFLAIEPLGELEEEACRQAWLDADQVITGTIEGGAS